MLDTVLPAAVITIHKDLCEKTTALSPYFHQKCALLRDLLLVSCEKECGIINFSTVSELSPE